MQGSALVPMASELLKQSPLPALRQLRVSETDTEIVIHGVVSSFYLKQLAQETVRPVQYGRRLHNRVIVSRNQPT
jgi:hypothetical protein